MVSVTARCELMENAFPADRLSIEGQFFAVEDSVGEHMIFCVDDFGKLRLVVKGEDGHNELINLSSLLGLSESSSVKALAVTQSRE